MGDIGSPHTHKCHQLLHFPIKHGKWRRVLRGESKKKKKKEKKIREEEEGEWSIRF